MVCTFCDDTGWTSWMKPIGGSMVSVPQVCACAAGDAQTALDAARRDLAAKQEPLGAEFDKVLSDNAWDLYMKGKK